MTMWTTSMQLVVRMAVIAWVMGASGICAAGAFLPTASELSELPEDPDAGRGPFVDFQDLPTLTIDGREYHLLDDVVFPVDVVSRIGGLSAELWPDGKVFYVIDETVTQNDRDLLYEAFQEWERGTCVRFIELTEEEASAYQNVATFTYSTIVGLSNVGQIGANGHYYVWIASSSWNLSTLCHEIGHVLGLVHEHQRSDSGEFVTLHPELCQNEGNCHRFEFTKNVTDYDFESLMHYARSQDSTTGDDIIVPKPAFSQWINVMGTLGYISELDREAINAVYCAHLLVDPEEG